MIVGQPRRDFPFSLRWSPQLWEQWDELTPEQRERAMNRYERFLDTLDAVKIGEES